MDKKNGKEHPIRVGIVSAPKLTFVFNGKFKIQNSKFKIQKWEGEYTARCVDGMVEFQGETANEWLFEPAGTEASFDLRDVVIGVDFHWEQRETQRFSGSLRLIADSDKLTAVNILPVEDYLTSVISSEMSTTASFELLKAHAVISRSWLLANLIGSSQLTIDNEKKAPNNCQLSIVNRQFIKWYERDAHTRFDVCADDHCQRYQGITRVSTPQARQAVEATRGQVLTYEGKICDARFSKSCGGISERFESCWADEPHAYLSPVVDSAEQPADFNFDLTVEANAEHWIRNSPPAFCNTSDKRILAQVLNHYDQKTTDFYRWQMQYTQAELSEIVRSRSGIDFGEILDLVPVRRGDSGRIVLLKIIGTKRTMTVGKELEIRKWFSRSHLYSSAFVADKDESGNFTLTGAGWGHGVGLCQIGAAVMGEQGYDYRQILLHYYMGAKIETVY